MTYNTQSLKRRCNWKQPDRWCTGRTLTKPKGVCNSVLGMLLEAGEVEEEDTVCKLETYGFDAWTVQ